MAVTIIDAPCGAGKTEYAIAYMNAHPENSFIFITPYLKEIERIKQGTKVAFYDPKNYQRPDLLGGDFRLKSKLDDFNHLLAQGKDIATTHATFTAATQETINILEDNSYHLIIDEAVDVLTPLNDIVDSPKNRVNKKDVSLMLNNGIIIKRILPLRPKRWRSSKPGLMLLVWMTAERHRQRGQSYWRR